MAAFLDNKIANYGSGCNGGTDVVVRGGKNDDLHHPITMSGSQLFNVDADSKVFIPRPNVG